MLKISSLVALPRMPSFFLVLTDSEARHALLHDECGDAVRSLRLIRHGKDDVYICFAGVGDEDLRSVQDVILTVLDRGRLLSGSVCTGIRLG